jgi:hypothetical protein
VVVTWAGTGEKGASRVESSPLTSETLAPCEVGTVGPLIQMGPGGRKEGKGSAAAVVSSGPIC